MSEPLTQVMDYHEATKHHFHRYARGPGHMDWATRPNPFRRYDGSPVIPLIKIPPNEGPPYDLAFSPGSISSAPFNFRTLSRLFFDSLALSAWKKAGGEAWALRVNPSSGNLHPTEGYLICGLMEGLDQAPAVFHYAPRQHALELRTRIPLSLWERLLPGTPGEIALVGLTSIHWRESWKYGERAYRYCALDVGHALGALSVAAAGLGWHAALVENPGAGELAQLLGTLDWAGAEREEPDCLLAVQPLVDTGFAPPVFDLDAISDFGGLPWQGKPNVLSRSHADWSAIDRVAAACRKPVTAEGAPWHRESELLPQFLPGRAISLRRMVHERRSAVAMDGATRTSRASFYRILLRTLPGPGQAPFVTLPWNPAVHLAVFVHRVDGLEPGLYFLIRDGSRKADLMGAGHGNFLWEKPPDCPDALDLYLLAKADVRELSMQISCFQEIAREGCFSIGMIADFERPLKERGAWFYPRLFWECGMIGQILYLEAEAAGLRGTGIGCFFDDGMHEVLGLQDSRFQDLYHFTVGGPIEDPRISTLPPYLE